MQQQPTEVDLFSIIGKQKVTIDVLTGQNANLAKQLAEALAKIKELTKPVETKD